MARGLGGPLLIGAGILGIAGIGYIYLKKEGTDFGELLDPAKWAQWLDNLLGIKPGGGNGDGNGNGGNTGGTGDVKITIDKSTYKKGDSIKCSATGLQPGEPTYFYLTIATKQVSKSIDKNADSTGKVTNSTAANTIGSGHVHVKGKTSGKHAEVGVKIEAVSTGGGNTGGGTTSGSITLGAAGDWGSGRNSNWQKVADQMINQKVNVMLGLGDYSYTNTGDWKKVIDRLKKGGILISRIAEGNHDSSSYASTTGQSSMRMAFDAGNARIIILNTESSVSTNVSFAETELKKTNKPWKIFTMHKPLYTNNSDHGAEKSLATALKPLINKYKVQLVMYGHNHNYQRIVKSDQPNTVFICSGTGGESHYDLKASESGTKYMNDSDYGFTKIVITATTLKGQFITSGGTVKDSWTQGLSTSNYARAYLTEMEPIGIRISI